MSDYWGDEGQPVCPMVFLSPKGGSIIPFFLEPSQVLDPSRAHWGTFLYAGPGGGNIHNVLNPLRQHYSRFKDPFLQYLKFVFIRLQVLVQWVNYKGNFKILLCSLSKLKVSQKKLETKTESLKTMCQLLKNRSSS